MAKPLKFAALAAIAGLALAACGGTSEAKTLVISSDLPLQGSSKDSNDSTNMAMELYLEMIDEDANTEGVQFAGYTLEFKSYDNATATTGSWDEAQCTKNATDHVANTNEIAVMGTYNSGCAKLIVPTLNQDPNGPMLMVSDANTNPGLTKAWDPGEPDKYYPTGKRNYARVATTDDVQGAAAAKFMGETLKATKCYVLNDNETYGQGVAQAFVDAAPTYGITILGNEAWDSKAANYTSVFQKIKTAGADCIYIGGIYDLNGGQLVKDKVAVLGDNATVPMMAPDGFTGYPDLLAQPEAEGMHLTFAGLSAETLLANGGKPAEFLQAYKDKYGSDPVGSYPLYGVAALQVILEAIKASDGTRAGVTNAVFSGAGVTVSADISILGKAFHIDPATGDVDAKDITIELVTGGAETTLTSVTVD